ncbi:MAG: citrate synthase/methylcitrate synthase [Hyphomicrobiales bacterium]
MSAAFNSSGLDDVVAAETVLSEVDGAAGRLIVRGFDLDELAGRRSFEFVLALLWQGFASGPLDEEAIQAALGKARGAAFAIAEELLPSTRDLSAVEALRLLLSALPDREGMPHHVLAVAAVPVFAAAVARKRRGETPVAPDASLGQAQDFLRMMRGASPPPADAKALETYLVAVADHGLNASTFAARVIASTRADLFSAVVGALCALKGPLHGGAPGPVLDMLDAIGTSDNIRPWLASALSAGERLMGFGHRVYRVRDPRADILKAVASDLRHGDNRIAFAEEVEAAALELLRQRRAGRSLATNVEFYTALVLEALALPRDSFTNVFAAGRVAGWTAHILEQEKGGRMILPQSRYVGPAPSRQDAA